MRTILLAAALVGVPVIAMAQSVDCSRAVAQVELTYCAEQSWKAADVDLNEAYRLARERMRQIDAALPPSERGAEMMLRDAQRSWVPFRDAACAAEGYMMHGGSAEPMVNYGCRARLTRQRTSDLRDLVSY
jgi:uncharacterized protein YecT (DUF1311 family)